MKRQEIAALLDEPACGHNHQGHGGCARPQPGAAAGGCAFDGAQIALLPIADVAHIVHGPIGCAGVSWDGRGSRTTGRALYRLGMTTDLSEQEVIMGHGEARLRAAIGQAIRDQRPAAVFVYNTCVTALIGDDLATVCREEAERWGVPVVPVDGAGFYGSKNLGNRIAGETMLTHVVGTREPAPIPAAAKREGITVHDINLVGEFNIAGEMWAVLPLLDELGLRVVGSLSGNARFRDVQTLHRAEVTMMVCAKSMVNVARTLEERYGIPWFEGSFYGRRDIAQTLRDFARILDDPALTERTEALIAREERRLEAALAPWRPRLTGKRAVLYTGGVKSWSVVSALQDLGMEVVACGTKKSTESDKARIRELMGDDAILMENGDPRTLLETLHAQGGDLLIAGGRNMFTALKARLPFLDINQEREVAYAGYDGMVALAHELVRTLESPIWESLRRPAPWVAPPARPAAPAARARIRRAARPLVVAPLKLSPTLGAILAFLGIAEAIPMVHGSQGCSAFAKVFLVRHFREPIPLQTTAMDQVSTVMGPLDNVVQGVVTLCERYRPRLIGIPTTGLSEVQGSDVAMAVREVRRTHPELDDVAVVGAATPDFAGGLERGYAAAVHALLDALVPESSSAVGHRPRQVNLLAGPSLTPGDVEEIKTMVEAFGLVPVAVPDLADSLDGHLGDEEFTAGTGGGTPVERFTTLAQAAATVVVGSSLYPAADLLRARTGVADYRFDHLLGLDAVDRLTMVLREIASGEVPAAVARQRRQLADAMLDAHFFLGQRRLAIAAEPELLHAFSHLAASMGATVVAAVSPTDAPVLARVAAEEVAIGDLAELEQRARAGGADLLLSNSHAAVVAARLCIPLLRIGYPQHDRLGGYRRTWVGYRGSRRTLFDLANLLPHRELPPYRSIYAGD